MQDILKYNDEWFGKIFNKKIPIVNENECRERIEDIKSKAELVNPYSFYMITDVLTKSITWTHRMEYLLGHKDVLEKAPISLNKYFAWIHPEYLELYLLFGIAMYRTVFENPEVVNRSDYQFYGIQIPIYSNKIKNYVNVFQRSLPLHLGPNNELITHLNIYTINEEFSGDRRIHFPAVTLGVLKDEIFWNKLLSEIRNRVFDFYDITFSEIQLNIIKNYIEFPEKSIKGRAKDLNYKVDRVRNSNKYIKQKLEKITGITYKSVGDAIRTHHFLKYLF